MRILYHHRSLADGAEGIHIAEMVAAFRDLGHEVHIRGLAAGSDDSNRRTSVERARRVVPPAMFELASIASNGVDYYQTRRAIAEIRPDFVYKRHARNDIGAVEAARHAGVPVVLEVNCVYTHPQYCQFEPLRLYRIASAIERRAFRRSTLRLAVSTPLARQIRELSSVEAVVLPNGADVRRFDPSRVAPGRVRARYGLGDGIVVGWTGVIRDWHGLDLLLDAMRAVPDARLLVVGDGPGRDTTEQRAASLGMSHRMTITGRIPHDEVPEHLAAVDIAVVANDRTGVASPMKLLEYMAMGRAVVAPRLENIRDVVIDGLNGILFTPGDANDLSNALVALSASPLKRAALGQAARGTVEASLNWHRNAERVVALVTPR